MNRKNGAVEIGTRTPRLTSFVLSALIALLAQRAHADDYLSPTDERLRVSLGAMHVSTATRVRANSSSGMPGTEVTGEKEFGLEKSDFEPKFQAIVRVASRHRLSFDYFTLDRSGNAIVGATPIVFRDVTFQPNDPMQTKLSLRTFGITYEYSFWHSEQLEIAGTFGVHPTEISASVRVQTQTAHIYQTENQAGPVPILGMDASWVVSKRFYLDGRAQYLKVHINDIDGSLGLYEFAALYRYRPNVSFAVGYTDIQAHLLSKRTTNSGLFDFSTKGPEMFVRIAF
jgi:hypothetical protein